MEWHKRLKRLRLSAGLTQAATAKLLGGYTHAAVSYWESGWREVPPAVQTLLAVWEHEGIERLQTMAGLRVAYDPATEKAA